MRKAFIADSSCHAVTVQYARPSAIRSLTPRLPAACFSCLNERQVCHAKGKKKRNDRTCRRVTATKGIVKSSAAGVSGGCPAFFRSTRRTISLSDRRRKRPAAATVVLKFSPTVRLPGRGGGALQRTGQAALGLQTLSM